jgi:hypothetical protein
MKRKLHPHNTVLSGDTPPQRQPFWNILFFRFPFPQGML